MVVIEKYTLCVRKIGLFMTRHSLEINSHLANILFVGGNRVTRYNKGGSSWNKLFYLTSVEAYYVVTRLTMQNYFAPC